MKKPLFLLASLFTVPVGSLLSQSTIVSDDFTSGVRNVQSLPSQMQWFSAGRTADLFVDNNALVLNRNNNSLRNTGAIGYFTDTGTINLPQGGSLTVSFNFRVNGAIDNNNRFWIGVYNSAGSRITADAFVENHNEGRFFDHPNFVNYSGYEVSMNLAQDPDSAVGSRLRRRPDTHGGERLMTTTGSTTLGSPAETMLGMQFLDGSTYFMEFIIEHQTNGVRTTLNVTGGDLLSDQTMTAFDPQGIQTSFDAFTVWTSRFGSEAAFSDDFIFEDFTVSFVPEPRTYALIFGAFALILGITQRRRRKSS